MSRAIVQIVTVAFHLDENGSRAELRCLIESGGLPRREVGAQEPFEHAALANLEPFVADTDCFVEQLYTFHAPASPAVAIAYYALVRAPSAKGHWYSISRLPALPALDKDIVEKAIERLRGKIRYQPIGFSLIPQKFTLSQLQRVYEVVLSQRFDKRNFRKRLRTLKLVKELDEFQDNVPHRAARLYRLNPREARYGDQLI